MLIKIKVNQRCHLTETTILHFNINKFLTTSKFGGKQLFK